MFDCIGKMYESAPFSEKLAQLETHHTTVSNTNGGPHYDGIYACIDLPSLLLGTIGGGTALATQKESLNLMGCYGKVKWIYYTPAIILMVTSRGLVSLTPCLYLCLLL